MKIANLKKYQLKHLTPKTIIGNQRIFRLIFLLAIFVTACRLLGPIRITWDQNIQLDAAFRITQGLGLTNAFSSQFDINKPPISEFLVHFPPGYSLLAASFLFLQISLVNSLKIIYSLTTLVGWFFWAIIASHCLSKPLRIGRTALPGNLFIAFALPVFYTPPWGGTDIFLWAGIPVTILLLLKGSESRSVLPLTLTASFTVGFLILFRYASAFLFPAALLIIFCVDYPRFKFIWFRWIIFALPYVLIAVLPIFYKMSVSRADFGVLMETDLLMTHGARYLTNDFGVLIIKAVAGFTQLYSLIGIGIGGLSNYLETFTLLGIVFGLVLLFSIFILFISVLKYITTQKLISQNLHLVVNNVLASLSCILIAFVIFSTVLTFVIAYNPLIVHRYYLPVEPCLVLISYRSASSIRLNRPAKCVATTIILTFFLFNFTIQPVYSFFDSSKSLSSLILTGHLSSSKVQNWSYPGHKIAYDDIKSIDFLTKTKRENPNSLYFAHSYPAYLNHPSVRKDIEIRRIPDSSFWNKAYVSEPTRVFWVINVNRCEYICASPGNFNSDDPEDPILKLESIPNLKTVFFDAEEGTRIFMSDLPPGYKFSPS